MALILIVEADAAVHDRLRCHLAHEQHEAVAATTGAEALQCIRAAQPELIILEVVLPDVRSPAARHRSVVHRG